MAFDPDLLIKMGDVREVIRDELAGKITAPELIHILFELKKHAFPAADKTDLKKMPSLSTFTARCKQLKIDSAHDYAAQIIEAEMRKRAEQIISIKNLKCKHCVFTKKVKSLPAFCAAGKRDVFGDEPACVEINPTQETIDTMGEIKLNLDGEVVS